MTTPLFSEHVVEYYKLKIMEFVVKHNDNVCIEILRKFKN